MHSQVVSSRLGVSVSCCRGLEETWPSVSDRPGASSVGARHSSVIDSKIVEDLKCRRPLPKKLGSGFLESTKLLTAHLDREAWSVSVRREILPASRTVDLLQVILDRWISVNLPRKTTEFTAIPFSKWLIISIVTSSLYLYTPTADAVECFTPEGAGNGGFVSSRIAPQNDKLEGEAFRARVSIAIDLLEKGQNAQAQGDFCKALDFFEEVKQTAGDLALAEYARVGHALTLYEVGDRSEAITEMEDVSIALRGYPEIHAALAAALYVDKHAPLPAEKQFNIATLLDPRYTNIQWVQENKHWPPSLINSLRRFITLQ